MKQTTVILIILTVGMVAPASASHWQPGDGNPAADAAQLADNFNDDVFADDWSPLPEDNDESSSADGSSASDDDRSSNTPTNDDTTNDDTDTDTDTEDDTGSDTGNNTEDDVGVCVIGVDSPCNADQWDDNQTDTTSSNETDDETDDGTSDDSDTGSDDQTTGDVNTDVSHDRIHELYNGHPPWEGYQRNEDHCFTHFHRDVYDEIHCGWELDTQQPADQGDTASEDRSLTRPDPPEAAGMEWISYPNSRDVMPDPSTAQDQPSALVCTILLNQDNEPITGHTVPDTRFAMEFDGIRYPEAHPATFTTPLTQNHDLIGTSPELPEGDGWLDSECFEFANLEPGQFTYSQPSVTGTGSDQVEFVGVTEHWDTQNVGEPYDRQVDSYGETPLSDGQFSLDMSHDGRHIEVAYVFRLQ
jgi:hypothetical protein